MKLFLSPNFQDNTYIYDLIPKNEFYGVLCGVKPVGIKDIDKCGTQFIDKKLEKTCELFKKSGLLYFITTDKSSFCGDYGHRILVYSKDKYELEKLKSTFSAEGINIGHYLGYPECCIKSHNNEYHNFSYPGKYTKGPYFYYLNDMSSYESIPTRFLSREKNGFISQNYRYFSGAFLTWTPCSYECKASIEKAKKLEEFISRFDQKFYSFILARAKKNVIFFDKGNWLSFSQKLSSQFQQIEIFEGVLSKPYDDMFSFGEIYLRSVDKKIFLKNKLGKEKEFIIGKDIYYFEFE